MGVEVNTDVSGKNIAVILGFNADELKTFELKYGVFMEALVNGFLESEDGINSADVYQNIIDTFGGKELQLFISQIASQAIISIVEGAEARALNDREIERFFESISKDCGPDCDCDED